MNNQPLNQQGLNNLQINLNKEEQKLSPIKYTIFRLDGHGFSKFVKQFKMKLPFDNNFTLSMKRTAQQCFNYFKFFIGFVGSDQITFAMRPLTQSQLQSGSTLEFNGRVEKMVSLLAGKVSTTFFIELTKLEGFEKTKDFSPHFDCRVFQCNTFKQVLQNISSRVTYTLKNSRMMLAQTYFSQKELNKIPSKQAVEKLLAEKNIDYNTVVQSDNRVGNVIYFEKKHYQKEIQVKGQIKEISFERKNAKLQSLSPTEVLNLSEEKLI